jgi:hypothetical protein
MAIRKKKVRDALRELRSSLASAKMDNANFIDKNGLNITNDIKETTRLYRSSWIIEPLERAIGILEFEIAPEK